MKNNGSVQSLSVISDKVHWNEVCKVLLRIKFWTFLTQSLKIPKFEGIQLIQIYETNIQLFSRQILRHLHYFYQYINKPILSFSHNLFVNRPSFRNFNLFQNLEKQSFENVSENEKNCIFICYWNTAGARVQTCLWQSQHATLKLGKIWKLRLIKSLSHNSCRHLIWFNKSIVNSYITIV